MFRIDVAKAERRRSSNVGMKSYVPPEHALKMFSDIHSIIPLIGTRQHLTLGLGYSFCWCRCRRASTAGLGLVELPQL